MKSLHAIVVLSAGIVVAATIGILAYQSVYNHDCNADGGSVVGFLNCTHVREDFAGPVIEGTLADKICAITGGKCPSYYIGNIQEDGSVMVGATFSNGTQEKQFVFLIKNGTLSYEKYVSGKPVLEPQPEPNPEPEPQPQPNPEPQPESTSPSGLQVKVTGDQQVRRGTTHDIVVDVFRDGNPVSDALVRITIEDYGDNVIRDFKSRTDDSGQFIFSWEIPKRFDDIKTLLAYVDVTDDISAKTILFKFQVYCLPGETGCKVEGN